ncbi:Ivy family c-type lysozyme inhibitor [Ancylobacter sp. SL191]|uniref:Ivy family c-type lysozyme inhibitor n=1 Tax=Ancylobacter sp. SL191 TaxID=2995166 RepID=UPI00226F6CCC|nr:Ivy family c-type lysozyme inhibitor [Ancylobacter sp. SL191]WAC27875.1 Ivy family c-type lysozyme inhibitor [Ancylobacter sp. SL191]
MRLILAGLCAASFVLSAVPAMAEEGRYLFNVVKTDPYRSAFNRMIAALRKTEPWLDNGVTAPSVTVVARGLRFEVFSICQPHNCSDNHMQVLFSPDSTRAYGVLMTPNGARVFGGPNAAQLQALASAF